MTSYPKVTVSALLLTAAALLPCHAQTAARKFTIYEFIPYHDHVAGGRSVGCQRWTNIWSRWASTG
jgi:hypothetical protein